MGIIENLVELHDMCLTKITLFTRCICVYTYIEIYINRIFRCFFMYFSCLACIFMHVTGETFGKSHCSPCFRSSECVYFWILLSFWNKRKISFPIVFSVPGFSHKVSIFLRFSQLFLDFARKKSVEFLKIQVENSLSLLFFYYFPILAFKILC